MKINTANIIMKKMSLCLSALLATALLSGCSSDSSDLGSSTQQSAPKSGTVTFANNTSMTITSTPSATASKAPRRAAAVTEETAGNEAQALVTLTYEGIPATAAAPASDFGWNTSRTTPVVLAEGSYGFPMTTDVYVNGEVTITNMWNVWGRDAKVIVTPAGKLHLNFATIDQKIYSHGDITIVPADFRINQGAGLYVDGDLSVSGTLAVGGDLYVGGNLTAARITADNAAKIHVLGRTNVTGEAQTTITNGAQVAAESYMSVPNLNIDSQGKLWLGCSLKTDRLTLHNKSVLTADYVRAANTEITASTLNLPENAVADLGDLVIGSVSDLHFNVIGAEGNAMIVTKNTQLCEQYSLAANMDPQIIFCYETFQVGVNGSFENVAPPCKTADGYHDVVLGTDLVNLGTPYAWTEGQCSPGFQKPGTGSEGETSGSEGETSGSEGTGSSNEGETSGSEGETSGSEGTSSSTEGTEPSTGTSTSGDVEVIIPTDIDRDWFLEADDFMIRVDGDYIEPVKTAAAAAKLDRVQITEDNLKVTIENVNDLDRRGTVYTYETWIWVKPESWITFSSDVQNPWMNGVDITKKCQLLVPDGFDASYNVYKGAQSNGTVPYIHLSVHVTKK